MQIKLEWLEPIVLEEGTKEDLFIYTCDEKLLPEEPGIYVFTRRFGKTFTPLYIGQATNLRSRIKGEFKSRIPLMKGIKKAQAGTRMLMVAKLKPAKWRRDLKEPLRIAEQVCIDYALSNGCNLLNVKGTKTPVHNIESAPPHKFHLPFHKSMHIKMR